MRKNFTRITSIGAAACLLALNSFAGNKTTVDVVNSTDNKTTLQFNIGEAQMSPVDINGVEHFIVNVDDATYLQEEGAPDLQRVTASIVIPDMGGSQITVKDLKYVDYPNMEIAPSKGVLYRNTKPSEVPFAKGSQYNVNTFYPQEVATLGDPFIYRDVRGQVVEVHPFQYNPVTKTLRVLSEVKVTVAHNNTPSVNEFTMAKSATIDREFMKNYESMFVNFNNSELKYTPIEESGSLLVIVDPSFTAGSQPLIDWKLQQGIETEVVETSVSGTSSASIESYISNYYSSNPSLKYVLFIGDHSHINAKNAGSTGWETKWSDSYYAFLSGNDHYPEILIGRLSVNSQSDLNNQVTRSLDYEKYPTAGDWFSKAIGLGSDEGAGYGDDGEADWQHLRNIRDDLLAYNYTDVYEFYDGTHGGQDASGDPSPTMISPIVNAGVSLFNYTGHGDQNTCITGNFSSTHINNASNNGMWPFVISVACNNGSFTSGTCISESWMNAKNGSGPTGAINACGSSILMAWAEPMAQQDEMADILTEQSVSNIKRRLGGLFYNAQCRMLEKYNSSGTAREVMETWVMFGDPTIMMRTLDPTPMTVQHFWNTTLGVDQTTVTCNTEDAMISITQDGHILGTGVISGGTVTITFDAPLSSTHHLVVTATAYNKIPYQGNVTVDGVGVSVEELLAGNIQLNMYPNPANDVTNINFNLPESAEVRIDVLNNLGQEVMFIANNDFTTGYHNIEVNTTNLNSGIYFVRVSVNGTSAMQKLMVK